MNLYVISIGGTGHRVTTALLNLAAAGAVPAGKIKLICVDSDTANGNLNMLTESIKAYDDASCNGNTFPTSLETAQMGNKDIHNPCWSPTVVDNQTLENAMKKQAMDINGQRIFDFLYTNEEQTVSLDRGFYGHTSIGSLLMAEQIRPDGSNFCKEWEMFFNGFDSNNDRIMLIGSTFGGTGASGLPVISTILRQTYPDAKIAALLVMPYFKFNNAAADAGDNGININWAYFIPKTRADLNYYEKQNFDKIFNEIFIIGEDPDNFMNVKYSIGSTQQSNKPHVIELYAASAAIDFLRSACDKYTVKVMGRFENAEDAREMSSLSMLNDANGDKTTAQKVASFMRAAVMYTKYYYHCLKNGKKNGNWYGYYNDIDDNELDRLYTFCMKYIDWFKLAELTNDSNGECSVNPANNVEFFSLMDGDLYNGIPDLSMFKNILIKNINTIEQLVTEKQSNNAEAIDQTFSELSKEDYNGTDLGKLVKCLQQACEI